MTTPTPLERLHAYMAERPDIAAALPGDVEFATDACRAALEFYVTWRWSHGAEQPRNTGWTAERARAVMVPRIMLGTRNQYNGRTIAEPDNTRFALRTRDAMGATWALVRPALPDGWTMGRAWGTVAATSFGWASMRGVTPHTVAATGLTPDAWRALQPLMDAYYDRAAGDTFGFDLAAAYDGSEPYHAEIRRGVCVCGTWGVTPEGHRCANSGGTPRA